MSLLLDNWPLPPDPPPTPPTPRGRRPKWPWLTGVTVGIIAWALVLGVPEPAALALFTIALAIALAGVALLARTPLPGWFLAALLFPGLILSASAATYVVAALGLEEAEGISPLNGFVIGFGVGWAVVAVTTCAILSTLRFLVLRAR